MRIKSIFICVLLGACTQFPALDDAEGPGVAEAAYPRLLSVRELGAIPTGTASIALQAAVQDRVSALRARSARLRGPVIDRRTRARMARGVR